MREEARRASAASVAKYLSIRYKCLPSSSTSRNKAAKLFSDNALLPFRLLEPLSTSATLRATVPRDIVVAASVAVFPKVSPRPVRPGRIIRINWNRAESRGAFILFQFRNGIFSYAPRHCHLSLTLSATVSLLALSTLISGVETSASSPRNEKDKLVEKKKNSVKRLYYSFDLARRKVFSLVLLNTLCRVLRERERIDPTKELQLDSGETNGAAYRVASRLAKRERDRIKFSGWRQIDNIAIRRDKFVSPALFPREIS